MCLHGDQCKTHLRRPSLHRASTLAGSSLNSRRMTVLVLSRSVLLCTKRGGSRAQLTGGYQYKGR